MKRILKCVFLFLLICTVVIWRVDAGDSEQENCSPHNWKFNGCREAKTCEYCGATGIIPGHSFGSATCTEAQKCTNSGCSATQGSALGHSGGTHINQGRCGKCFTYYQTHGQDGLSDNYDVTYHYYKCLCSECTFEYPKEHQGDKHNATVSQVPGNVIGRYCDICKNLVEVHQMSTEIDKSKNDENGHYYTCSACSTLFSRSHVWVKATCTSNKYCSTCGYEISGSALVHSGGTHANGGICTVCKAQYQTHSKAAQPETEITATTHDFTCTYPDCTYIYTESHEGGTHANSGHCTICNAHYQAHLTSVNYDKSKATATQHYIICSHPGCTETIPKAHEWMWSATEHAKICSVNGCKHKITHTPSWIYADEIFHRCNTEGCIRHEKHNPSYTQSNYAKHAVSCSGCGNNIFTQTHRDDDKDYICDKCGGQMWELTYDINVPTNKDVTATLKVWDGREETHTFEDNGTYNFELINPAKTI